MKLYAVRHIESGQFLHTARGKIVWPTVAAAKNAWIGAQPYRRRPKHFDAQSEWEVIRVQLVPMEKTCN